MLSVQSAATCRRLSHSPSEQFCGGTHDSLFPGETDDARGKEFSREHLERRAAEIIGLRESLSEQLRRYLDAAAKRNVFVDAADVDPVQHDAEDVHELERLRGNEEARMRAQKECEGTPEEFSNRLVGNIRRNRQISARIEKMLTLVDDTRDLDTRLQAAAVTKQENDVLEQSVLVEEEAIRDEIRTLQSLNDEILQLETETADLRWQVDELEAACSAPTPDF